MEYKSKAHPKVRWLKDWSNKLFLLGYWALLLKDSLTLC